MSDPRKPAAKYTPVQHNAFKTLGIPPTKDEKKVEEAYIARILLLDNLTESKAIADNDIEKIKQGLEEAKNTANALPGTVAGGLTSPEEVIFEPGDDMWENPKTIYGTKEVEAVIEAFLKTLLDNVISHLEKMKQKADEAKEISDGKNIEKLIYLF